jgi:hypothetical protein
MTFGAYAGGCCDHSIASVWEVGWSRTVILHLIERALAGLYKILENSSFSVGTTAQDE